jgi:hypothetical protein
MKFIIYNPATNLFDFFINSLIFEFKNRDIETIVINKNNVNFEEYYLNYKKDIILILINPHFIFDYEDIDNTIKNINKIFTFKILYLTEPINFIVEKRIYLELISKIKPYLLWTYTYENFNKVKTNLNIFKIFPQYNISYNFTNTNNIKDRDIEKIIFLGNINENREDICNQFGEYLINKNNSWSKREWSDILDNHLFYLNIHRRLNCKSFESFRIIPILSNGGVIFSERCNSTEENIYKNFNIIFVEKKDLYDTFLNYKKNINFETIYQKTLLFRNNLIKDDLDNYLDYHNKI